MSVLKKEVITGRGSLWVAKIHNDSASSSPYGLRSLEFNFKGKLKGFKNNLYRSQLNRQIITYKHFMGCIKVTYTYTLKVFPSLCNSRDSEYIVLCFCWKNDIETCGALIRTILEFVYFISINANKCQHRAALQCKPSLLFEKTAHGNKSVAMLPTSIQVRKEDKEDVPCAEEPMYYLKQQKSKDQWSWESFHWYQHALPEPLNAHNYSHFSISDMGRWHIGTLALESFSEGRGRPSSKGIWEESAVGDKIYSRCKKQNEQNQV